MTADAAAPTAHRRRYQLVAVAALLATAALLVWVTVLRSPGTHGPFSEPLLGPWFGLKDNIEGNTGGWFGGLTLVNDTESPIEITAVWGIGASENLQLGPVWRGRGTPDPVIWPEIDPDRLTVTPLEGDAVFEPLTNGLENSLIVRFDLAPIGAAELRGFRIDYRFEGEEYRLYLDTYHCVAPAAYFDECEGREIPPAEWHAVEGLPATPIRFADSNDS